MTALRRCPELVFVKPRFDVYRAVSRQIHGIFADYTSLIQPLSLDEAYLDVTQNLRRLLTAWATAREIRASILEETGLTASAGISCNKLPAKLASGHRKPDGQFAVTAGLGAAWVEALPVACFHGVGPVTAKKMQALDMETGADLRARSMAFLQERFGKAAGWHYAIARGEDDRPVDPDRMRKSSGSETTFDRDLAEAAGIEAGVLRMADDVSPVVGIGSTCGGRISRPFFLTLQRKPPEVPGLCLACTGSPAETSRPGIRVGPSPAFQVDGRREPDERVLQTSCGT